VCEAGDCLNGNCDDSTGIVECSCDVGWALPNCDSCAIGFHDEGGSCVLNEVCGSPDCVNGNCDDSSGIVECSCDAGWALPNCDSCDLNYHDEGGACVLDEVCNASDCIHGSCDDSSGIIGCTCDAGWELPNCDTCASGYHDSEGTCVPDENCTPGVCNNGSCDDSSLEVECYCDFGWQPPACATPVDVGSPPNRIFSTQTKITGTGVDAAGMDLAKLDDLCMTEAVEAGLSGNFVAYFSTEGADASDRIVGTRGYVNTVGEIVADTYSELTSGDLRYVPAYDASGAWNPGRAWTGSQYNGEWGSGDCDGWTSEASIGSGGTADSVFNWGGGQGFGCGTAAAVMCVQVDHADPVAGIPVPPANARLIFLGPTVSAGVGVAAMDEACQAEWEGEMGASTGRGFKALVATAGASAASRFSQVDTPWIRPDGVVIADTSAQFFSGTWGTGVARKLTGPTTTGWVVTGADAPNIPGPLDRSCLDWTSSDNSDYYTQGFGAEVATAFNMGGVGTCGGFWGLYCAEDL
jgi:hypothetical protein